TVAAEIARVTGGEYLDVDCPRGVLVEYAVQALGQAEAPLRARIVRQEQPEDWAVELRVGMGIDLLTGDLDGVDSQVEVHQLLGNQILLRTDDRAPIALQSKYSGSADWIAPEYSNRTYLPRIRSVDMDSGCFFYLPESGIYGRLRFRLDEDNRCWMTRNLNLYGTRQLPLPPSAPEVSFDGQSALVTWTAPSVDEVEDLDRLRCHVEYEYPVGSGDWAVISQGRALDSELSFPVSVEDSLPLGQVRLQYRYDIGVRSSHGESTQVLWVDPKDESALNRVLEEALAALESDSYDRRYLGKQVLLQLGERAWPRLLDLVTDGSGASSDLAREILLGPEALEAGMLQAILQRAAGSLPDADPLPEAWADPDGNVRVRALLLDFGQPGLEPWYRLMARMDPDPSVRDLAELLASSPVRPEPASQMNTEGLWAQVNPKQRMSEPWPDWAVELHGVQARDGAAAIRAVVDGSNLEEAHCLFALSRSMEGLEGGAADPFRAVRLGLDLVEQYRTQGKAVLLQAIREGVLDSGATLIGWRDLSEFRWTQGPERAPVERSVVRLDSPSLAALQQALDGLETAGTSYADVILPAGVYGAQSGLDHWVDVKVDGVALIGEPGVQLEIGVRATGVRDVILCNLEIRNSGGSAVAFTGATGSLRNLTLSAAQTPLSLQDSVVELDRCRMEEGGGKAAVYSVRMIGPSILTGRGCDFDAGTLLMGNQGQVYLDRCTLDGGSRPVVQGQSGGTLVMRDCVILGGSMGFQGMNSVLLEGVLSTLRYQTFTTQDGVIQVCPEHVHAWESWQGNPAVRLLPDCPLSGMR
ncbi:MAG: hypothetical protein KDB61_03825, partial [Planctomycetes bacterium]|nr:hypothetical protein [Planctomycetota bacterium]